MAAIMTDDFTDAVPFRFTVRGVETDGEFVRFEATVHPRSDRSGTNALSHHRWLFDNPAEHLHPYQAESIEVLSGEYVVAMDGTEHTLTTGDPVTVPKHTPHRHWNPTRRPVRFAHEHHPARDSEAIIETYYALAQAGRTDDGGLPNLLQTAVVNDAYPGHVYLTTVPIPIQRALISLLAPVGRLMGYRGTYRRDDLDELR